MERGRGGRGGRGKRGIGWRDKSDKMRFTRHDVDYYNTFVGRETPPITLGDYIKERKFTRNTSSHSQIERPFINEHTDTRSPYHVTCAEVNEAVEEWTSEAGNLEQIKKDCISTKDTPYQLNYNTHLPEMEHYMKEAVGDIYKLGLLSEDDRVRLMYCPPDSGADSTNTSNSSVSGGLRSDRFGYPAVPLYRQLANIIEEWMWSGTCYLQELPKFENLEEGDNIDRRKMVLDTISCHLMGLRTSWDGLENDMKKHKLVKLLKDIGKRGILDLIGVRHTVGTVDVFPPTRDIMEASFRQQNKTGSKLTVGARALDKHCLRDETQKWWGKTSGGEQSKNENAEKVLKKILNGVGWMNIHQLPHALPILEVRNFDGYGARWSPDGTEFRGFLEPQMIAGWEVGYKH